MTQRECVLFLLRQGPQTTNALLNSRFPIAAEYRRCIVELRTLGHDIIYTHGKGGTGVYRLLAEPTATGQAQLGFMQSATLNRRVPA